MKAKFLQKDNMYKRAIPALVPYKIVMFPHCDQRILHAPGECQFCDKRPDWQALRVSWGIAFTGYQPEGKELPDPATYARDDSINKWYGNVASPEKGVDS